MKRRFIFIFTINLLVIAGLCFNYNKKINSAAFSLEQELEQKNLMEKRVAAVTKELQGTEEERDGLKEKVSQLASQIDSLIAKEVTVFDSEAIAEEVREIGELATQAYGYTNVGTMDTSKNFKIVGWKVPFTQKTAVVSMDGVIKAGIDLDAIDISCDEKSKVITIKLPNARILSNELDEDSLCVYDESSGIFNSISIEDNSLIRSQIKEKAESNAIKTGLLLQAKEKAADLIRCIVEAAPGVKENYTIIFK